MYKINGRTVSQNATLIGQFDQNDFKHCILLQREQNIVVTIPFWATHAYFLGFLRCKEVNVPDQSIWIDCYISNINCVLLLYMIQTSDDSDTARITMQLGMTEADALSSRVFELI